MTQAANKLYSRREIREELKKILRDLRRLGNAHLVAFGMSHASPCAVCKEREAKKLAIIQVIRHFGGRPCNE